MERRACLHRIGREQTQQRIAVCRRFRFEHSILLRRSDDVPADLERVVLKPEACLRPERWNPRQRIVGVFHRAMDIVEADFRKQV
jgi:hypothetical protein